MLTTTTSSRSVAEAVDRLVAAVEARGIRVFARIDHAAAAREAGLELADEQVLVFGDPRAGTGLMQANAEVGIELPLKMLVWDDAGTTKIGWRRPTELAAAYGLEEKSEVLGKMTGLLELLAAEAAGADGP